MKIDSNTKKCKCDHFLVRINTVDQRDSNPFSLRFFVIAVVVSCRAEQSNVEQKKHIQRQWCALNFLE